MKPKNKCPKCGDKASCSVFSFEQKFRCDSKIHRSTFYQSDHCKDRVKVQRLKRKVERLTKEVEELRDEARALRNPNF